MAYNRRLSDKIIAAHKQACEENRREVAELLLQALQLDVSDLRGLQQKRKNTEMLEEAFERHAAFLRALRMGQIGSAKESGKPAGDKS